MTFKDVAGLFTWDEWIKLCPSQRSLYQNVMLESYGHLVSLGEDIVPVDAEFRKGVTQHPCPWIKAVGHLLKLYFALGLYTLDLHKYLKPFPPCRHEIAPGMGLSGCYFPIVIVL